MVSLNSNFQRYVFLSVSGPLSLFLSGTVSNGPRVDMLGFAEQIDSDEIVALQEHLGALGRVCGVQAVGSRTRRDSWGIFFGRRWVGHETISRHFC